MGQRVVSPILRRTTITATTSCRTEFLDMAIAQGIREIPAHTHEPDVLWKLGPLAADHPCAPSRVQSGLQRESIPEIVQK